MLGTMSGSSHLLVKNFYHLPMVLTVNRMSLST